MTRRLLITRKRPMRLDLVAHLAKPKMIAAYARMRAAGTAMADMDDASEQLAAQLAKSAHAINVIASAVTVKGAAGISAALLIEACALRNSQNNS